MLPEEAEWFAAKIAGLNPSDVFPMLDVGSSTEKFRTKDQPWIDAHIFKPAREKGFKVVHTDIKKAPGVDLAGDLTDPAFTLKLKETGFKSVFCANLLEHIPDRTGFAKTITALVPEGGYIFASCPRRYPYHPEPMDTMYRPTVEELASIFPNTRLLSGETVTGWNHLQEITRSSTIFAKATARLLLPIYKPKAWLNAVRRLPYLNKKYQATCVVLRKVGATPTTHKLHRFSSRVSSNHTPQ